MTYGLRLYACLARCGSAIYLHLDRLVGNRLACLMSLPQAGVICITLAAVCTLVGGSQSYGGLPTVRRSVSQVRSAIQASEEVIQAQGKQFASTTKPDHGKKTSQEGATLTCVNMPNNLPH